MSPWTRKINNRYELAVTKNIFGGNIILKKKEIVLKCLK